MNADEIHELAEAIAEKLFTFRLDGHYRRVEKLVEKLLVTDSSGRVVAARHYEVAVVYIHSVLAARLTPAENFPPGPQPVVD